MSKLTEIQNELKAKKSCYNKFGKYHYRKCEDILEALKPLLKKHDCTLNIDDGVHTSGSYTYIEALVSFRDNDGFEHTSCAQAGIEKAGGMALPQAFGAASSYARKYALGAMFLLDDTEDADATNDHQPQKPADVLTDVSEAETVEALTALWKTLTKDMQERTDVKNAFTSKKEQLKPKE